MTLTQTVPAPARPSRPFPAVKGIEVEHKYVDIGGVRIHVAFAGAGEPLVMCHGWPQNWWMWRELIPRFAGRYRVIAPDMRGFGWSDAPPGGYLKDDLADDFVKLMAALKLSRVKLLSHDWGGWIGYIVSSKHPGLISQHFATNIPPIWPKLNLGTLKAILRFGYMVRIAAPFFGTRLLMRDGAFVHHLLTRGATRSEGWTEHEKSCFSDQFREEARARASSKLYGWFLLREFVPLVLPGTYHRYRVGTPTRLLFGENDFALALAWLDGHQGRFEDFELELVPRTGHFIVDERPELVAERASAFFDDPRYRR
jgi:pimeloyl-ACP methyl ester carboxylesterase